ncbi:MAG: CDP-alcohol phosphatidyltransferase family protein [Sulfuriferula sp.]
MPNLPNIISLLRLLLVPVVIYLLALSAYGYALAVFLLASVSDGVDGWIARHYHLQTKFGAMMDPVADKLIILSCLLMLTWQGLIPLWLALFMLVRDMVIVLGAFAYRRVTGHVEITPTFMGKTHIFLEFSLLCLVLANAAAIVSVTSWLPILFMLVSATAVLSGAQYVWIWSRRTARHLAEKTY